MQAATGPKACHGYGSIESAGLLVLVIHLKKKLRICFQIKTNLQIISRNPLPTSAEHSFANTLLPKKQM